MFSAGSDGLSQVLNRFLDKVPHGHTKTLMWRRGNVFFEDNVMYSYGHHFPLVVRRSAESNLKDGKEWYLCNGDKYSPTTTHHQSVTFRGSLKNAPRIAFSALSAVEIIPGQGATSVITNDWGDWGSNNSLNAKDERLQLVDSEPDYYSEWPQKGEFNPETREYKTIEQTSFEEWRKSQPMGSSISIFKGTKELVSPETQEETQGVTSAYAHRVGVVLLRFPKFKMVSPEIRNETQAYIVERRAVFTVIKGQYRYFLCGMDEGSYFISELALPAKNISAAFQGLKPSKVRLYESQPDTVVLRQGDWFFVPLNGSAPKIADSNFRQQALPPKEFQRNRRHNNHFVRLFKQGKDLYCKGTVYHRSEFSRGDHRPLTLPGMCLAFQNTSIRDWSASGSVD